MNDKKTILFVDDDPKILQGIRRNVRIMRDEWEASFAESGQKALQIMKQSPTDLVVTDMRMPGMDGAQLLQEVKALFPETIRIILSGQAEEESLLRSTGSMHQFLSKPCEFATLIKVINRACSLRDYLDNPEIKRMVLQMKSIPSYPKLYNELMDELKSANATIEKVGKIISQDFGMSTKILQLANSAYFGYSRKTGDADQAVQILGLDTIQAMVLAYEIFSKFDQGKNKHFSIDRIWDHSMHTGGLALKIAKTENMDSYTQHFAFTAGLVHEIGLLILAQNFPDQFQEVLSLSKTENITICQAEAEVFKVSHGKVAAYLLGLWGLPDPIVEAVAFHHSPEDFQEPGLCPLTFLHAANAFENELSGKTGLNENYLKKAGAWDKIPKWKTACQNGDQEK